MINLTIRNRFVVAYILFTFSERTLEYALRKKNDSRGELDGYEPEPVVSKIGLSC